MSRTTAETNPNAPAKESIAVHTNSAASVDIIRACVVARAGRVSQRRFVDSAMSASQPGWWQKGQRPQAAFQSEFRAKLQDLRFDWLSSGPSAKEFRRPGSQPGSP